MTESASLRELEVDGSPLRATKGGEFERGQEPRYVGEAGGPRRISPYVDSFFVLVAHFFDFLTHLKLSCIFVTFFGVSGVIFRGFGRVWGGILGGFFDDF